MRNRKHRARFARTALAVAAVLLATMVVDASPAVSKAKAKATAKKKTTKKKTTAKTTIPVRNNQGRVVTTTTQKVAQSDVDPNGVLTIAQDLTNLSSGPQDFDITKSRAIFSISHLLVYDSLLRAQLDGSYTPGLAKTFTVVNPTDFRVVLQPNVKFSDGTAFDADAVKFNVERTIAGANAVSTAAEMQLIQKITVESPLQLLFHLSQPISGFFIQFLSRGEFAIASPTAIKNGVDISLKPVGAGPFLLQSLNRGQSVSFVKNPDYFQADQIRLAGVRYVNASASAITNALRSGDADAANLLTWEQKLALRGLSNIKVNASMNDSIFFHGQLCKANAPFDDVRVRQALNYGLDRDRMNALLYDGESMPQYGLYPPSSKFHDPANNNFYKRDIVKAKELLTAAGFPNGFSFDILISPGDTQRMAEIMQEQWKDIGVTTRLVPTSNVLADYYNGTTNVKAPLFPFLYTRMGVDKVTRNLVPGSTSNSCQYNNPTLNRMVNNLKTLDQNSPEAIEAWHQMETLVLKEAMNIFGIFGMSVSAWNSDRVANVELVPEYGGGRYINVRNAYIRK
jgi:ABC-type transport system substrate-binding protein